MAVFETSGVRGEIALANEQGLVATRSLQADRKHARDLVPLLQSLLDEQNWTPTSLELIIADLGPGSYTGLRVGLTSVKTLCYATKAAVVGVATPAILAAQASASAQRISTVIDAQQGMVYATEFVRDAAGLLALSVEAVLQATVIEKAEAWSALLQPGTYVTGPALSRFRDRTPAHCIVAPEEEWQPRTAALWRIGWQEFQTGRRDDFWTLEPLYLRASSAELKWDRHLAENKGEKPLDDPPKPTL